MAQGSLPELWCYGTTSPGASVDQYGATLGQYFGVQPGAPMDAVFPNLSLGNFSPASLGFMG